MSENELRPCPFCGCTDNFITVTSNPFSNDIYSTTHCKCYATGPFIAENYLTGEKVPTREHMEERATERWNTRPIEDDLRKRIAELEGLVERLIEIGDWATIGMVISESYSPSSNMRKLAEDRRNEWEALVKDWKEREE